MVNETARFEKVLRNYGAIKNATESNIINYYNNILEDKTEEIRSLMNIAKINVYQGKIGLETIEDTIAEILKENPALAVGISKLIMSAYLLTVCSNIEELSPETTEFELSEVKNAISFIEAACLQYVPMSPTEPNEKQ